MGSDLYTTGLITAAVEEAREKELNDLRSDRDEWKRRADKAEQERDEAVWDRDETQLRFVEAVKERDNALGQVAVLREVRTLLKDLLPFAECECFGDFVCHKCTCKEYLRSGKH